MLSHSASSCGVSLTSWPGSRTQAPSSADLVGPREPLQHRAEGWRRQPRLELQPQALEADSRQIGIVGVERFERGEQAALQTHPSRGGERENAARDRRCGRLRGAR